MKKLTLKNFQAHKHLEIEFHPQVTTIVGPSDVGKSAVIRALRWVLTNRPSGAGFIRHGAKCSTVELIVELETRLTRSRGGSTNVYKLNDKEFEAFGNDVPPEIAKVVNVADINFQGQFASPYWFDLTGGQVSRELNQIVNLEVIDSTLANLSSLVRKAKAEEEVLTEQLDRAKAERERLQFVKELEEGFEALKLQNATVEKLALQAAALRSTCESVLEQRNAAKNLLGRAVGAEKVLKSGELWGQLARRGAGLRRVLEELRGLEGQRRRPVPTTDELSDLEEAREKVRELQRRYADLFAQVQLIRSLKKDLEQKRETERGMEGEFTKSLKGICPLCGQTIPTK